LESYIIADREELAADLKTSSEDYTKKVGRQNKFWRAPTVDAGVALLVETIVLLAR
jgi:hypothetical protein